MIYRYLQCYSIYVYIHIYKYIYVYIHIYIYIGRQHSFLPAGIYLPLKVGCERVPHISGFKLHVCLCLLCFAALPNMLGSSVHFESHLSGPSRHARFNAVVNALASEMSVSALGSPQMSISIRLGGFTSGTASL